MVGQDKSLWVVGGGRRRGLWPVAVTMFAVILLCQSAALAGSLIGIGSQLAEPVVDYNQNGVLTYTAATKQFLVTASPVMFLTDIDEADIVDPRSLAYTIQIDNAGNLIGGTAGDDFALIGTIDVDLDGNPEYSGVLLTGEIEKYGFQASAAAFDFVFVKTGGALASLFGAKFGVTITQSDGCTFTGSFAVDFSGGAKGYVGNISSLGAIGDYVWEDTNKDGIQDDDEFGVPDVTVNLLDANGTTTLATTTTGEAGDYLFPNLVAGTYIVEFEKPDGFTFTTSNQGGDAALDSDADATTGRTAPITLAWGQTDLTRDAGLVVEDQHLNLSSLAGHVYHDANNNGLFEPDLGETGIANVTVTLTGSNDLGPIPGVIAATDSNGFYKFTDLRAGTYTITETQPGGYLDGKDTQGTPGTGTAGNDVFADIALAWGVDGVDNNFGELFPGSIAGFNYVDTNDNGIKDAGEAGIPGTTIVLSGTDDLGAAVSLTAVTDGSGAYMFSGLRPGTYAVHEEQNPSYLDGKDTAGSLGGTVASPSAEDSITDIPVDSGEAGVGYNFGELTSAPAIAIIKYTNGQDADEAPGPVVQVGSAVTWTYEVTNKGNVPLSAVKVTDDSGTPDEPADDFSAAYVGGDANGNGVLDQGEVWKYKAFGIAIAGQYENWATIEGTSPAGVKVTDRNPSHYLGSSAELTIVKSGGGVCGNTRTIGFWKTNIDKHLKCARKGTQVTKADLLAWLRAVQAFDLPEPFTLGGPAATDGQILCAAEDILSYSGRDIARKTERQLLACELNLLSGTYALGDAAAHGALCKEAEDALNTPGANLSRLHDLLDDVNNMGASCGDSTKIRVGDSIIYTITITAANLPDERDVEVRDYLDSSLKFLFADNGGEYVAAGNLVQWFLTLPAGNSVTTLHLWVTVTALPRGDNQQCPGTDWKCSEWFDLPIYPKSWYSWLFGGDCDFRCFTCPTPPPPQSNVLRNRACIGSPPSAPEPGKGCTHTIGYWKNHPQKWPVNTITIGGRTYTKCKALAILKKAPKGDATIILARQLIAAKLNIAAGADPTAVESVIAQADEWLAIHPIGSRPDGDSRQAGIDLAEILDDYNSGIIGPGPCVERECDRD